MEQQPQLIEYDLDEPRYYARIPHMADDDLDLYEYRLYGHYRRVAGESGGCRESNATTASKCDMSVTKMREARSSLAAKGYITLQHIEDGDGNVNAPVRVQIVNRWRENNLRYLPEDHPAQTDYNGWRVVKQAGGVSPHARGGAPHARGGAPDAPKEESIKKNNKKKDSSSTADAGTDPVSSSEMNVHLFGGEPPVTPKARPRDVVFDAVVEHCFETDPLNALEVQQLGGGRVGRIVSALRKAYKGVLDDQQLADELGQFAEAWAETELTMPQHEDSLLPNLKKWRDGNAGTPAQVARAMNQPLRVRASCDDPACKGGYVKTPQGRVLCRNCWEVPDRVTA